MKPGEPRSGGALRAGANSPAGREWQAGLGHPEAYELLPRKYRSSTCAPVDYPPPKPNAGLDSTILAAAVPIRSLNVQSGGGEFTRYGGFKVNSAKLNDWLQVIGLFAVVASLIFVGLQMKQTDTIALSEIYQARAIAAVESNSSNANNPYFLSGTAKLYTGRQGELTAQEAIALEYDLGNQLIIADNYLMQYDLGYLSESYWARSFDELTCALEHPWYRQALVGWMFRDEFKVVLERARSDAIENPTGCWNFEFPYPIVE